MLMDESNGNEKISEVRIYWYMVYSTLVIKTLVKVEYTGIWCILVGPSELIGPGKLPG